MKTQIGKFFWKFAKISWMLLGVLIIINLAFWLVKATTSNNIALILILSVFIGYSIIALISYIAITLIFFLIKYLVKIFKK